MTNRKWLVGAAAVALLTAACDQSPTEAPANEFELAALVGSLPSGAGFEVTACVEGPAGAYNFTASTTTGGTTTLNQGAAFSLTAGDVTLECALVASSTTSQQNVTVTQVGGPPNTQLADISRYRFATSNNTLSLINVIAGPGTTVGFGNDFGWVLVFRNIAVTTGCTLTQGYWKTHSEYGPAPYDNTWALLANGADTPFFGSGQTWLEVFNTEVSGNAYYNLAHQYMAAVLNGLAGASQPQAVIDAISDAETLFGTYDPDDIAGLKGNDPVRQQFLALAGTLDQYNNGLIGPGHCID